MGILTTARDLPGARPGSGRCDELVLLGKEPHLLVREGAAAKVCMRADGERTLTRKGEVPGGRGRGARGPRGFP